MAVFLTLSLATSLLQLLLSLFLLSPPTCCTTTADLSHAAVAGPVLWKWFYRAHIRSVTVIHSLLISGASCDQALLLTENALTERLNQIALFDSGSEKSMKQRSLGDKRRAKQAQTGERTLEMQTVK